MTTCSTLQMDSIPTSSAVRARFSSWSGKARGPAFANMRPNFIARSSRAAAQSRRPAEASAVPPGRQEGRRSAAGRALRSALLRGHDADPECIVHQCRSAAQAELLKDLIEMRLDGDLTDREPLRDLGILEPDRDVTDDLSLARRERIAGGATDQRREVLL